MSTTSQECKSRSAEDGKRRTGLQMYSVNSADWNIPDAYVYEVCYYMCCKVGRLTVQGVTVDFKETSAA